MSIAPSFVSFGYLEMEMPPKRNDVLRGVSVFLALRSSQIMSPLNTLMTALNIGYELSHPEPATSHVFCPIKCPF